MNDDELKWMDTTQSDFKLVDSPTFKFGKINHLALTQQALFITTTENNVYGYGSDEWISVQLNNDEWTFVTKFESAVKSVKAGISHIVVLLENGEIFGCGLNDLEQAGQPKSFALKNSIPFVPYFTKFAFPINLIDKIEKVYCVSGGTILQTRKEFICIGVFAEENGSVFGDLCAERIERNCDLNHVSTGHGIVYSTKRTMVQNTYRILRVICKEWQTELLLGMDIDVLINKL
ncbi:hypothetical protein ABK040_007659 [Willaertia magna]